MASLLYAQFFSIFEAYAVMITICFKEKVFVGSILQVEFTMQYFIGIEICSSQHCVHCTFKLLVLLHTVPG